MINNKKALTNISIKTEIGIKEQLLQVLSDKDMTISEASNLLYVFIAEKKRFPREIEDFLISSRNEKYGLFKAYLKEIQK